MLKNVFQDITNISTKRIKLTIHKSSHRKRLLRWLYEVCRDFRYSLYTYTAAVLIVDKYTEKNGFELKEYQLIGISCLFLAAKIEESKTRRVLEYSVVTDGAFTEKEILRKEWSIFESLDHELHLKLPQHYFNPDYFKSHFSFLDFEYKKELLNCFIASQLEIRSYTRNVFLLYLESKREMEVWLANGYKTIPEIAKFYIRNNPLIHNILYSAPHCEM